MAYPKTYKTDKGIYEIPEKESASFLKDFPNAMEVVSYKMGKDTFDIPVKETQVFLKENPQAVPLKKKEPSEPLSKEPLAGGLDGTIPTITQEKIDKQDDVIGKIQEADALSKKVKETAMPGSGKGGQQIIKSPDFESIAKSKEIHNQLKDMGYGDEDIQLLTKTFSDLPPEAEQRSVLQQNGELAYPYSKKSFLELYKSNPIAAVTKANNVKNFYELRNSAGEGKASEFNSLTFVDDNTKPVNQRIDDFNSAKEKQKELLNTSLPKEKRKKAIDRVEENSDIILNNIFQDENNAKSYLIEKLRSKDANLKLENPTILETEGKVDNDLSQFSLESIAENLDPKNKAEKLAFRKYKYGVDFDDAISTSIDANEAALKFASAQNPTIKGQIEKLGNARLPNAYEGEIVNEFLNSPDVIKRAQQDSEFAEKYDQAKNNLYFNYPEFAKKEVATKISQGREDEGINNWFANIPTKEGTDKLVDKLVREGKMTEQDKLVYQTQIRDDLGVWQSIKRGTGRTAFGAFVEESPIQTPGLLESTQNAFNKTIHGVARSVEDVVDVANVFSDKERLYSKLQSDASTAALVPKSLLHEVSMGTGNLAGFVIPMMAGGAALSGVKGGEFIANGLLFEGENKDKALTLFPDDPTKQYAYTAIATAGDMMLGHLIPKGDAAKGISKTLKGDIVDVVNKFTNKEITAVEAKKTLLDKTTSLLGDLVKENTKVAGTITAFGAFHNTLDALFDKNDMGVMDIATQYVKDFKSTFLTTPLLAGMALKGKSSGIDGKILMEVAGNPELYKKIITEQSAIKPELKATEAERLQNLEDAASIKKDLDKTEMTDKQKQDYMITAINKKILERKAAGIADKTLKQSILDQAEKHDTNMVLLQSELGGKEFKDLTPEEKDRIEVPKGSTVKTQPSGTEGKFTPLIVNEKGEHEVLNRSFDTPEAAKIYGEETLKKRYFEENIKDKKEDTTTEELPNLSVPIEGTNEKGIPVGENVPPPTEQQSGKDVVVDEGVVDKAGSGGVEGEKTFTKNALDRADAKKIFAQVREVDTPTDAAQVALEYIANGGKVSEDAINEVAGTVKRASLNTGARELKSSEVKARDYSDKKAESLDQLAHNLWELHDQKIPESEIKDALMEVIGNHNTRLDAGKAYLERYSTEYNEKKLQEKFYQEHLKEVADELEFLNNQADIEKEAMADEKYVTNLIEKYETESKGQNQQPATETKGILNEGMGNKESAGQKEEKITNEEPQVKIPIPKEEGGITEGVVSKGVPETETGEGKEPPIEPIKPVDEGDGKDKLNDKGILNHLASAENVPEASKKGFEEKGLKYNTSSQKEAESVAKSIIDKYGLDDAVLLAEAQKFDGDVNSLIYAESLNRLAKLEESANTPEEKLAFTKKFAEVGIKYDEAGRKGGRFNAAINYFYKKSPLGIKMIENAKRKEAFEEWSKPKDKSWKEFFDEMIKEPEFDAIIKEQVKEGMKKERAEARAARIKKVDEFFDKAKDEFKGGAAYSTIIPPKVITTALEGMKRAYHAGEKVAKLVEDAIDYISEQIGHSEWGREKFRKEWTEKLKDKETKKPLTDEEIKAKILDKFRNKLKGLTDKEKEEVVRRSFQKIVESGGLDYADFKKIIADITGRGELTEAETARLKELVKETNLVDEAAEKARTERTQEARKAYFEAQTKAAKASKELNELLYNRPNIVKRLTSIMQLNTLGIPALVNNPIYNIWNQTTLRLPVGIVKTVIDQAIKYGSGGKIAPETNIVSGATQAEFFSKLGLGTKEAFQQFFTGLNRADYTAKEIQGQQIRPATAWRDLWAFMKGKKNLTGEQALDKSLQATVGIPAEIVARTLNLGDKPQRFAAEGAQAAAFAKALGLKDIDYDLFIDFPREEAYRAYKEKKLSDAEAGKKADYIRDTIIKEGQRSTFQQDNMLNDVINRAFGGEKSGIGSLAKAVTISPYIKIPSNAYWSYYNLVNPEVAFLQSAIYGVKAALKQSGKYTKFIGDKDNTSAAKDLNEAKYWFAHGAVGMATRAVIVSLVGAGIVRPSNTGDDTKKEREGEQTYEQQGTINVSKLFAAAQGKNPDEVKNGLNVQMRWFGHWGTMADRIAKKEEDMTPEQKANQGEFWDTVLGGLEIDALKDLNQGVFSNTSSMLTAVERGDFQNYGVNLINMFANIVQPAALAQIEKASMPYYTKQKADTFWGELNNTMLTRSKLYRDLTNQYPPSKIGIWGDKVEKKDNLPMRLFGISRANPDNFAQPIYEDYKRTNNTQFLPPSVRPEISGNGETIKLPTKDAARLEELVGQQRKILASPYVNDMATFEGSAKTYSKLSDEEKLDKLRIIYEEGYKNGKELFLKEHPEYIIPEKTKQEKRQDKKESRANKKFRKALQNN